MLSEELHYLLLRAFHHSNKAIVQKIPELDLFPGQPKILEYLLEHNGSIAKEICEGCVLDKSTIANLLPRMEKQDLIIRKPDTLDKRSSRIYLTEKGLYLAKEVKKICFAVDDKALCNISAAQKEQFLATLNLVINNLEKGSNSL